MAKELVAKKRFDDGSKKREGFTGSLDYEIGEKYLGDAKSAKDLLKSGLLCSEAELTASKEVINEKDKMIADLKQENMDMKKALEMAEGKIAELSKQE